MLVSYKRKIGLVVYVLLLIGLFWGIIHMGNQKVKSNEQTDQQCTIVGINTCISGKITSLYFRGFKEYDSSWKINDEQCITFPWAENWAYPHKHLAHFLQVNDSVYKPQNSDTLYIYRNNEEFCFVLKKRICSKKVPE